MSLAEALAKLKGRNDTNLDGVWSTEYCQKLQQQAVREPLGLAHTPLLVALVRIGVTPYPSGPHIGQLSRYRLFLCHVPDARLRDRHILHAHLLDSPVELERHFIVVVKRHWRTVRYADVEAVVSSEEQRR
jgi:hypothetical protein